MSARRREAPLTAALKAPDFRIGAEQSSAAVERRDNNEQA